MDATLAQHEALLARPGAHQVQGGSLPPAIERAPERLAINGDHLALKAVHEGADPGREPALEGIGIDEHEHAPEGIVRGNAGGGRKGLSRGEAPLSRMGIPMSDCEWASAQGRTL